MSTTEEKMTSVKKECLPEPAHFSTDAIHAGQEPDPVTGAIIPNLAMTTTFAQKSPGQHTGFEYQRSGNPTRDSLEANLAKLENAKYGLCFSCGLATTTTILSTLKAGDHVISVDDVYGGTNRLFRKVMSKFEISFDFVDLSDEELFEKTFTDNTKMVWLETPTNPTLKVTDIAKVAEITHAHGCILVVDNTFMSPFFQRPLDLGADIVMHSVTKYINGHSDIVMGTCMVNDDDLHEQLRFLQNAMGAVPAPFDCYQVLRSTKTLALRMRQHEKNAFAIAEALEAHDKVDKVYYPGLESHPQHEIAKKQMSGFGGMITFWVKGEEKNAVQFLENVKIFTLAESLGGVESLCEHPAIMTHASVPEEQRKELGIDSQLIRLSCGVEDVEDLLEDINNALEAVTLEE